MTLSYVKKRCLFCEENENVTPLYEQTFEAEDLTPEIFSARRIPDHFHYRIVRCQNCGLVFSREVLEEERLFHLYSRSEVTYGEYEAIVRQDYWRHLEPYAAEEDKGTALEIGCGRGFFLEELIQRGFREVYGCEPSVDAKERAHPRIRENIHLGFFDERLYEENRFDLACSFQTLDHVGDPLKVVETCHAVLKSGGLAYFITHDVDSLQSKILREKSPIIDVEHIYLFNKKTLRKIFEMAGFTVLDVSDVRNSYPLSYWLRMLPLFKRSKPWIESLMNRLRLGSVRIPLAAGNIYIIARCTKG